jgi:hypothetical protein
LKKWRPKTPKISIMNVKSMTTVAKLGNDFSRILTSFFIEGIAFTLLRGRIALIDLIPLKDDEDVPRGRNSRMADIATMKSRIFHQSLRYDSLCTTKPFAAIFNMHSRIKIPIKFNFSKLESCYYN